MIEHRLLLLEVFRTGFLWVFSVSMATYLLFGPQVMVFHRLKDNVILGRKGFEGIRKAWSTLLWFWVPAYTLTFLLPVDYQVGLAALWSVALGLIMGLTGEKQESAVEDTSKN